MNKVLFLYTSTYRKQEIEKCEEVFRAIMRKFRKSVSFHYLQADTSLNCRSLLKDTIGKLQSVSDAVIWSGDAESSYIEEMAAKDIFGIFAAEHFTAGRCVCYPLSTKSFTDEKSLFKEEICYMRDDIEKSLMLAVNSARQRKHHLTVCTADSGRLAGEVFREFEYALGSQKHIDTNYISYNELIWQSTRYIPTADILLTTNDLAQSIIIQLCSSQRFPTGYAIWHGDNVRIYRRENLPFEKLNNNSLSSLMLAFSGVLRNELKLKSASVWLCSSVASALERCSSSNAEDFVREVVFQINKPMRKRGNAQ